MSFNAQRLGERILVYRRRKDWTQRDLATHSGVSHITVARLERGQIPYVSVDVVARLADALEVSLDQITGWVEESEREPATLATVGTGN
jgi:transcriptional regulator with XRE-family HTH domain